MDLRLLNAIPDRLPAVGMAGWAASVGINLLGLALPLVVLQVYDLVLPNAAIGTLALMGLGLVVALMLDAALRSARGALAAWGAARFEHRAVVSAAARLLSADTADLAREPSGSWMDRFTAIDRLAGQAASESRFLAVDLAFAALFFAILLTVAGPLAWTVAGVLSAAALATWALARAQRAALSERSRLDDHRLDFMLQTLSCFATIKAMAAEALMLRRMERLQASGADQSWQVVRLAGLAQSAAPLLTGTIMGMTAGLGALAVAEGRLSLGGLAASVLLAGRLAQPCLKAIGSTGQMEAARLARARMAEIAALAPVRPLARLVDRTEAAPADMDAVDPDAPAIRFETATAEADAPPIDIAAGEVVLIDGAEAGEVLRRAAGLTRDGAMRIAIHGRDAAELAGAAVLFAGARPFLFAGTLLDNATGFDPHRIDAALTTAAELGLAADISRLADGWETEVASGDRRLPEGVRQKLSLARVLAARPQVLVLEHPSGALDRESDAMMIEALKARAGSVTILLATPRPSVRRIAGRRLFAAGGTLTEQPLTEMPVARAGGRA